MKELNRQIVCKDTKTYTFRLTRNGLPVNISGWYVYFTVKADWNDADSSALISKSYQFPSNSESIGGVGYLALTSADTNITIGEYVYDFKFVDTNYRETFQRGHLNIIPSARIS
jgi:hypothetical protein